MAGGLKKTIAAVSISVSLAAGLQACASQSMQVRAAADMPGILAGNVYTSPQRTFRTRMPWLSTDAAIRAESTAPDSLVVTIADDLCREFIVSQDPGSLEGQSLESWVETNIVARLKQLNLPARTKSAQTRNAPAIAVFYRAPGAAPCGRAGETGAKTVATRLDAEIGLYVYYVSGLFYRVSYVIGIGPEIPTLWYVNREPVDEVLAQFANGFEILTPVNK